VIRSGRMIDPIAIFKKRMPPSGVPAAVMQM